jgi:uncharacterized protein YpmS
MYLLPTYMTRGDIITDTHEFSTLPLPSSKSIRFNNHAEGGPREVATPRKNKIRGAIDFMNAAGISHVKSDVFRYYGVSHTNWLPLS